MFPYSLFIAGIVLGFVLGKIVGEYQGMERMEKAAYEKMVNSLLDLPVGTNYTKDGLTITVVANERKETT